VLDLDPIEPDALMRPVKLQFSRLGQRQKAFGLPPPQR
jgi:hypothetical protein